MTLKIEENYTSIQKDKRLSDGVYLAFYLFEHLIINLLLFF